MNNQQTNIDVLRHEQWIANFKAGGHATASYTCPADTCNYVIEAPAPENEGETYDSAVKCRSCGCLHFKVIEFGKEPRVSLFGFGALETQS